MLQYDEPVIRYLAKAGDMIMLNMLWRLIFLYLIVTIYVWALMARFENALGKTIFNAGIPALFVLNATRLRPILDKCGG